MKKFGDFFGMCAYTVGSIGGFGVAVYNKSYFIAACVAVLAVMAFPTVKEMVKDLNS